MTELILHNKWKSLADYEWTPDNRDIIDGSVVFVHMDHIYDFFKDIARTNNRVVLISADSDYGLRRQDSEPVWKDMGRWLNFIPITDELGYNPVVIPARMDPRFCKLDDLYSIKVYSFTKATIDNIPENITHWFTTNCDCSIPGISHIPFGIPEWNADLIQAKIDSGATDKNSLSRSIGTYVNFQVNTLERASIKNYYRGVANQNYRRHDIYVEPKEISHEEYIERMIESHYVISPPGNGLDCFRTLEAIYCGCIPVINRGLHNQPYFSLPHTMSDDFINFSECENNLKTIEGSKADFGYWREKISERRKNLLTSP